MNDPFRAIFDPTGYHRWFYYRFGHVSLILICLTSNVAQQILMIRPIQYLGRISYGFYLLQQIAIEWVFNNMTYDHLPNREKWWYQLLAIFLAVATNIVMAEVFTRFIDDPIKNFVYRFEMFVRQKNDNKEVVKEKSNMQVAQHLFIKERGWVFSVALLAIWVTGVMGDIYYTNEENQNKN